MKAGTLCLIASIALAFAWPSNVFGDSDNSAKVAKKVAMYIAKTAKKENRDPKPDFEKIHKICSRSWHKKCFFWEVSGKDQYRFRKRPKGKIYGIPSFLRK